MSRYRDLIFGSGGKEQDLLSNIESTVNYYITQQGEEAQALCPSPGFSTFVTADTADCRALTSIVTSAAGTTATEKAFAVMGTKFKEVTNGPPAVTERGSGLTSDSRPAQIVFNGLVGNQLFVASGGNGYSYDLTSHTLANESIDGEAQQIGMLDGYFLALNVVTGKLRISGLDDGTTWDPTQFALRSAQADPWIGLAVNPPDIWLIGSRTGDIWVDKGTAPFPLAPRTGLTIPYGIAAPFSIVVVGGAVIWLARNGAGAGQVVMATGYNPQPISTPSIDRWIDNIRRTSTIDDAEAMVFQKAGHTFYVLRFPSYGKTIAYDLSTGRWLMLGKYVSGDTFGLWTPRVHCDVFGIHLVGDATAILSKMDTTYGREVDDTAITRMRIGSAQIDNVKPESIEKFTLVLEAEEGVTVGTANNPVVTLATARDGGTFGSAMTPSVSPIAQNLKRVTWTRLGSPRLFVPKIKTSDPVPWRIIDCYANNEAGS